MRAFAPFAVRDIAALAITVGLVVLDAGLGPATGALPSAIGVATGVMVAVASFLLHEWGHWSGAVLSGGVVAPAPRRWSPFLFHFDTGRSTRKQFLWMSAGGYFASVGSVLLILAWADLSRTSGMVALGLASVGLAVTFALEIPTTVRVARGAPLPTGGVYEPD